jgi:hypothetical protein
MATVDTGPEVETDPVECLRLRQVTAPDDYAPACGEWLSDHCPDCLLCPGHHADGCPEATARRSPDPTKEG